MAKKKPVTGCKRKGLAINKPRRIRKGEPGYGKKKFVVCAKEGNKTKTIRFGDANMKIRKSNPKARKSFRARHKCDQKNQSFQQVTGPVVNGNTCLEDL